MRGIQRAAGSRARRVDDARLDEPDVAGSRASSATASREERRRRAGSRRRRGRTGTRPSTSSAPRVAARPGCRRSRAARARGTPSGRPVGVPAVADADDVERRRPAGRGRDSRPRRRSSGRVPWVRTTTPTRRDAPRAQERDPLRRHDRHEVPDERQDRERQQRRRAGRGRPAASPMNRPTSAATKASMVSSTEWYSRWNGTKRAARRRRGERAPCGRRGLALRVGELGRARRSRGPRAPCR